MSDLGPAHGGDTWDITVLSEPFTTGSEDVGTAVGRLQDRARERDWDVVVGLTELPLHDDEGRHLLVQTDRDQRTAVLSLPALGGVRMHARSQRAVRSLIGAMSEPGAEDGEQRVVLPHLRGRWRLLLGMVLANRPWLLVPGLKSALVASLATGAVATVNSTVWLLADSLSWWRLVVATVASIALVVGWLVIDGELWDRPEDESVQARERSRLYNASTLLTLTAGVLICYVALFVVNLAWALFILDPDLMGGYLDAGVGYPDLVVLAWFVASAATVGGGLGSGLPIYMSAFGPKALEVACRIADGFITTKPDRESVSRFRDAKGPEAPTQAGFKVAWASSRDEAIDAAYELWPNSGVPGELSQVLPSPQHFEQASELVTRDAFAGKGAFGPAAAEHVAAYAPFVEAGFDDVYVANMGPHYADMLAAYGSDVLPELRRRA